MTLALANPVTQLLREGNIEEFNRVVRTAPANLENADLRMADLRRANLAGANLRGAYLRNSDLRGLDLSTADMDGASIHEARLGGTLFPASLSAEEIRMSHALGTRMRTRRAEAPRKP